MKKSENILVSEGFIDFKERIVRMTQNREKRKKGNEKI